MFRKLEFDMMYYAYLNESPFKYYISKTGGVSNRRGISNIIMQGSKLGSLYCVALTDKLGQLVYSQTDVLYFYKGKVPTPPLQMVDDILGVQQCSKKSVKLNGGINTFIELEKLTLSEQCKDLRVHDESIYVSSQETYLGDKIKKVASTNTLWTVELLWFMELWSITPILAILNEIPLNHCRVKAGALTHTRVFSNASLFNSEAWHGVTDVERERIEKVDEALLRVILNAHAKVPKEALWKQELFHLGIF